QLSEQYPYPVMRFFILQAHYRMPLNFTNELLDAASVSWQRISTSLDHLAFVAASAKGQPGETAEDQELIKAIAGCRYNWQEAMDDDLNTADAIAAIFELVRAANTAAASGLAAAGTLLEARAAIIELCGVLGLEPEQKSQAIPEAITDLAEERSRAKQEGDFARADALRDEILSMGYKVEDTPQGVRLVPLT
ncbi:MAG: cysteine--tRNA ligase, partial [Clostridiaceae bacterium]|nr:cysteine--tRNA ligase [Clostridiaceae bacterium]